MSDLPQKLKENKDKIRREKFLAALDAKFSDFLANTEFSSEVSCVKYAAFQEWDEKANIVKTSRSNVKNWNNFNFSTWQELITVLKKFQQVKSYIGWFFIEQDGPYYSMSLNAFLSHIQEISNYGIRNKHYTFGWVGQFDDVGIIIDKNPIPSSDKELNICIWGI